MIFYFNSLRMRGMKRVLLLFTVVFLFGCTKSYPNRDESDFAQNLLNLSKRSAPSQLNKSDKDQAKNQKAYLSELTNFEWEEVCPSWAYEDYIDFKNRLKIENLMSLENERWQGDELTVRLVFFKKNQIVKILRLHRAKVGDFSPDSEIDMSRCFNKEDAKITVEKTGSGAGLPSFLVKISND